MFGMTKRQFLKRSKKALGETGILLLLFRDTTDKKNLGKISNKEASKEINNIRKGLESVFSEFEKNEPPSECSSLKQRILKALITLHETIMAYQESLAAEKNGEDFKLTELNNDLKKFRESFLVIVREVDSFLLKKRESKN